MEVTTDTFVNDVVERSRERPVVVDFWADWCGPCHALAPVLERAVAARDGAIELAKVDVDANAELANEFGVHGIPAVKAFKDGRVVAEFTGAVAPAVVETFLDGLLAPSEAEAIVADLEQRGALPEVTSAYREGDHERVLATLLELVRTAEDGARDELRRLMVALFGELGQEHPLAVRYRRSLASALY